MTISRQLTRLCLSLFGLMIREFVFVLIQITVCSEFTFDEDSRRVETSQQIFIAKRLFGFYIAWGIIKGNSENSVDILSQICSFMFSIDRINSCGILFVLNLLFDYCSGLYEIIYLQRCRLNSGNIAEQLEFKTIAILSVNCSIKKYLN